MGTCGSREQRATRLSPGKAVGAAGDIALRKWQCLMCAFVYDEVLGWPEGNLPPGMRWADVPEDWTCPDCGACKGDFEMIEVPK